MKITFYAKNKDPPVSSNSFAIMDTVWYILLIVCIGPPGARFNPKKNNKLQNYITYAAKSQTNI